MKYGNVLIVISTALFLTCAPPVLIKRELLDGSFSFGQIKNSSKVGIVVSDSVQLLEYKKSFRLEYKTNQHFSSAVRHEIASDMEKYLQCTVDTGNFSLDTGILFSGNSGQDSVTRPQALFATIQDDYVFVVKSVDISAEKSKNSFLFFPGSSIMAYSENPMFYSGYGVYAATDNGYAQVTPGFGATLGGQEGGGDCYVTMYADLWNVTEKRKILSYSAEGNTAVAMMLYGTAIKNSIWLTVKYLVKYLASGTVP